MFIVTTILMHLATFDKRKTGGKEVKTNSISNVILTFDVINPTSSVKKEETNEENNSCMEL